MFRTVVVLAIGVGLGFACTAWAFHHEGKSVRQIASHDIREKIDGKESKVTVVEVTIPAGVSEPSHRHPGPAFVYVLEGEYEIGIDDQQTKIFKAGETFYEPSRCLHRVSRSAAKDGKTRLIAFVLHPRTAEEIVLPADEKH